MVAFWIAVGAVRERDWVRWVERKAERPRDVKGEALGGRGALEGEGSGASSVCVVVGAVDLAVGL